MSYLLLACAASCLLSGSLVLALWRWRSRQLRAELRHLLCDPLGAMQPGETRLRLEPFGAELASLEARLRAATVELQLCRAVLEGTEATGSSALEQVNDELERRNAQLQESVHRLEQLQVQLALTDRLTSLGTLTAGDVRVCLGPLPLQSQHRRCLDAALSETRT